MKSSVFVFANRRSYSGLAAFLSSALILGGAAACKPDREEAPAAVQACRLTAYVAALEGVAVQGLDPEMDLALLPAETIVTISGVAEGRLRISRAVSVEEEVLFSNDGEGDGWIPVGLLVTGTEPAPGQAAAETANDGLDQAASPEASDAAGVPVFAGPITGVPSTEDRRMKATLAPYDAVNILGCRDDWAYIEGTSIEGDVVRGWLAPDAQCGNPVSSCS